EVALTPISDIVELDGVLNLPLLDALERLRQGQIRQSPGRGMTSSPLSIPRRPPGALAGERHRSGALKRIVPPRPGHLGIGPVSRPGGSAFQTATTHKAISGQSLSDITSRPIPRVASATLHPAITPASKATGRQITPTQMAIKRRKGHD